MTTILIAAFFFVFALGLILIFRSAVSADDELERKWVETVHQGGRQARGDAAPTPEEPPSDDVAAAKTDAEGAE